MFSIVTLSKLIIFVLFYYIVIFTLYFFLHTRSFLVPYTYVSIESIDCILLSSFELKATLLISSVKTLWLRLLSICCDSNISLLFLWILYDFLEDYLHQICFSKWFILFSSWNASEQCLWSSNWSFLFTTLFFVPLAFLSSLLLSIK